MQHVRWILVVQEGRENEHVIQNHEASIAAKCGMHTGLYCFFLCLSESVCHLCSRTWVPLRRKPMAAGDPRLEDLCSRLRRPQYMTLRVLESEALNKIQQAACTHLPLNLPLDFPLSLHCGCQPSVSAGGLQRHSPCRRGRHGSSTSEDFNRSTNPHRGDLSPNHVSTVQDIILDLPKGCPPQKNA